MLAGHVLRSERSWLPPPPITTRPPFPNLAALQMKDGDELTAVPEASDSQRQQTELGPLFATVFGSKAAAAAGAFAKPQLLREVLASRCSLATR